MDTAKSVLFANVPYKRTAKNSKTLICGRSISRESVIECTQPMQGRKGWEDDE